MDHFAGLDVSVKETSVCIVDDVGKIVREVKVASEPEALLAVLKNPAYHFKRPIRTMRAEPVMPQHMLPLTMKQIAPIIFFSAKSCPPARTRRTRSAAFSS